MKFRNQARLCLAIHDFEGHIMLSLCLTFQSTGLSDTNADAKCEFRFSDFY